MNRVSPKALLISLAAMLALDTLGGMILTIFFASQLLHENTTHEQTQAVVEAVNQSSGFLLSALAYGTVTTILGGYLAARLAKRLPYFNAGALGLASIAIGILLAGSSPLWFDVVGFFITLPAALFGGHLAKLDAPKNA
jgi:MFS family permease